jgi:putative methionine-R-sulfoxide reductase with GAF domain
VLDELELDAALQLLVERAQYITGATGSALALPHGDEMVCRASAGSCAPTVGARLQVRSGLTGESIARRQLLRCDNAEADPRVNLETCRALGIASIVVLPLLRRSGEVRGLFELFSDHPYAFEERDLIALERMADLTLTALDLAEQRHGAVPPLPAPAAVPPVPENLQPVLPNLEFAPIADSSPTPAPEMADVSPQPGPVILEPPAPALEGSEPAPRGEPIAVLDVPRAGEATGGEPSADAVPEAMQRVRKCASCGFPVSEGRSRCIDCEKKQPAEPGAAPLEPAATSAEEPLPAFLANAQPVKESWLANPVNLLAIVVLIVGVLVAVVVFR